MDTTRNDMDPRNLTVSKLCQLAAAAKPADLLKATVAEIKYDGHRIMMYRGEDRVRVYARSGVEKSGLLRTIERIVKRLPVGTWLDGEVCSFNADGTNDWGMAQSILGSDHHRPELEPKATYVVFDMLSFDGKDMRRLPAKSRREILESSFAAVGIFDSNAIMVSPQFEATDEAIAELIARGFEGAIVKDPTAAYASGKRGYGWFKIKGTATADVVVMGTKDGKGKFSGQVGALVFGQYDAAGNLVEQGACSGMDDAQRLAFTAQRDAGTLNGTVLEIAHMGIMPTGGLRHPQFKRIRTDKLAASCTIADQANSI